MCVLRITMHGNTHALECCGNEQPRALPRDRHPRTAGRINCITDACDFDSSVHRGLSCVAYTFFLLADPHQPCCTATRTTQAERAPMILMTHFRYLFFLSAKEVRASSAAPHPPAVHYLETLAPDILTTGWSVIIMLMDA